MSVWVSSEQTCREVGEFSWDSGGDAGASLGRQVSNGVGLGREPAESRLWVRGTRCLGEQLG